MDYCLHKEIVRCPQVELLNRFGQSVRIICLLSIKAPKSTKFGCLFTFFPKTQPTQFQQFNWVLSSLWFKIWPGLVAEERHNIHFFLALCIDVQTLISDVNWEWHYPRCHRSVSSTRSGFLVVYFTCLLCRDSSQMVLKYLTVIHIYIYFYVKLLICKLLIKWCCFCSCKSAYPIKVLHH